MRPLLPLLLAAAQASSRRTAVPHWLVALGMPGLLLISFLDASIIPLPIPGSADILLLLLCAQRGSHPVWLAIGTVAASVIGGFLTHSAGRKGGEAMFSHYTPARAIKPVTRWVKDHGFLTISVSGLLPPPVPLMPLLLGAGALGASRRQFLPAFTLARGVRYGIVAALGATYGRRVLHWWNQYLAKWSAPILWAFFGLLLAGIVFGFWQWRRTRRSAPGTRRPAAVTGD